MEIDPQKLYAVLTGDVVKSSALSLEKREGLVGQIRSTYDELRALFPGILPLPLSVYRGDGWQMLVPDPGMALALALSFRSLFLFRMAKPRRKEKELDLRMAIGIGGVDFVPAAAPHEGDGPAFRRSGRALEMMNGPQRMAFSNPGSSSEQSLSVVVELLDALFVGWTPLQARAVVVGLQGLTQEQVGDSWPVKKIRQQTVGKHLRAARWSTVEAAVELFQKEIERK